jgi:DNA replication and repair protein RecF
MIVEHLELLDFRNYTAARLDLTPGVTVVLGANGQGKTNLAEALSYLALLESFRGAPTDALVRIGADAAVVRATIRQDDGREVLVEAEISRAGRSRVLVNRQRLGRQRDLLGVVRVTVFSPDDLVVVKGGPGDRRRFLDGALIALAPKYDALRLELDRVLRQRNVLLKQGVRAPDRGAPGGDAMSTLDVWDERLADLGEQFGHARATLVARLTPYVDEAYAQLAGVSTPIDLVYEPSWRSTGLVAALAAARSDDVRRQTTTVGPHRDELEIVLAGMPARTHASQGEQRTLALALRLGAHRLVAERTDSTPVLVLDDVLSELDEHRATALLGLLPAGQVVITTAGRLPEAARPDRIVHIEAGAVR